MAKQKAFNQHSMYILVKKINDVHSFFTYDDGVLAVIKTGEEYVYRLSVNEELLNGVTVQRLNPMFLFYNEHFYYSDYDGNCFAVNVKTKQRAVMEGRHIAIKCNAGKEFLINTVDDHIHDEIIDITTFKTLLPFDQSVGEHFFSDSHFYCTDFDKDYNKLFCYERGSYRHVWTLDVTDIGNFSNKKGMSVKGEVVSIIGEWNNLLLVHVTRNKLLAINTAGMPEWEIENFFLQEEQPFLFDEKKFDMKVSVHWLLNKQQGKLYLLSTFYLFEFDLRTREKRVLKDYSRSETWVFKGGQFKDNTIFFCGFKERFGYPNYIGIFDLSQNEVVWEFKAEGEGVFRFHPTVMLSPVIQGEHFYIKDSKDVLYVFKKSGI